MFDPEWVVVRKPRVARQQLDALPQDRDGDDDHREGDDHADEFAEGLVRLLHLGQLAMNR